MYQKIITLYFALLAIPLSAFATIEDTERAVWVNEAIVATYTYDYKNYLAEQKAIAVYFTAKGWISYSKALNDSKLPEAVLKNAYSVSAVATLPPTIKMLHENYWHAEMPLLVVYKNPQSQQKQHLLVNIEFTTTPSGQGVRGLALTSLQATEIKDPKCP